MFLNKIRKTIAEYNLLENGDNIICAVSGGADSVCLLNVLLELRDEYGVNIFVANVNHLIRKEESDNDSRFVKDICRNFGLKLYYREYDVRKIAAERKIGEEECGRILRYEFFDEIAKELGNAKIATAHNLNDNAETVIFRLVRGTAAQGFGGIMYKRDNIIRPLLDASRKEIEEYLSEKNILWCEDSTNKLPIYARNKIRLGVIPLLNEVSGNAEEKIVSAARLIADDNRLLNEYADEAMGKCFEENSLLLKEFEKLPFPVKRRIIARIFVIWGVNDVSAEKIEQFAEFTMKDSGKKFDINAEFYSQKSYDRIILCERAEKTQLYEILDLNKAVKNEKWKLSVCISSVKPKKRTNDFAVFDADRLSLPLTVTYRKNGDKIRLKGMSGTKKLSDIFTDEKTEAERRSSVPIVRKENEIIYIGGLRQSSLYAVDENTDKFLIISYERSDLR